jgi:hypothetical protein
MTPVPTLLNVLRETLKTLQGSQEFLGDDPYVQGLRRWLLLTIADLEELESRSESIDSQAA